MINTVILRYIFRGFVVPFSLHFFSVCFFICVLLILSVYFYSSFALYFSFINSAFLHHIFIPIALCIYSLFFISFSFPIFLFPLSPFFN